MPAVVWVLWAPLLTEGLMQDLPGISPWSAPRGATGSGIRSFLSEHHRIIKQSGFKDCLVSTHLPWTGLSTISPSFICFCILGKWDYTWVDKVRVGIRDTELFVSKLQQRMTDYSFFFYIFSAVKHSVLFEDQPAKSPLNKIEKNINANLSSSTSDYN